jgi:hypothetical protein
MDNASAASLEPRICPFLRAVREGQLADPVRWPDGANACTALGDAAPQSLRQQEYACLASAHVNCPRFVRGVHLMVESTPPAEAGLRLTPAILGALLVLAASFALSVGFVVANGGMDLPEPSSASSPQAAIGSVAPSAEASAAPALSEPPAQSAAPSPDASVGATTATPAASTTPSSTSAATPRPTSDRYALLEPCGNEPDCWVYTVREGDNLVSIARYFGVTLEVIIERNPWTETTGLVAGQELRLPPPTR